MSLKLVVLLLMTMMLSNYAGAATNIVTVNNTANVEDICSLNTIDLSFGELNFVNKTGNFKVTGYANIRCTMGTVYKMSIETVVKESKIRYLISPTTTDRITYAFYKKDTNILLGDTGVNDFIQGTGTGLYERVDFDAKIDTNQIIKHGYYKDTVTISVNY